MILESLDPWLDFKIPKLIFVIPIYQIKARALATCMIHYMLKILYKYPVEIMIHNSRIFTSLVLPDRFFIFAPTNKKQGKAVWQRETLT